MVVYRLHCTDIVLVLVDLTVTIKIELNKYGRLFGLLYSI